MTEEYSLPTAVVEHLGAAHAGAMRGAVADETSRKDESGRPFRQFGFGEHARAGTGSRRHRSRLMR